MKSVLYLLSAFILCIGCGSNDADAGQSQEEVRSYIEGRITLNTEVDSVADYSGFEILIGRQQENQIDTLAYTETDEEGMFAMDVVVPEPNIYSLILGRDGAVLKVDEIAIAQDDSATLRMEFPFGNRPVMVRSLENAALLGYRNTMSLYNRDVRRLALTEGARSEDFEKLVSQTTELLWNLRESNPSTIAAGLASVQSILLLEGWNDSLVVARTRQLDMDNPSFGSVIGTARRAQIRLEGTESAVDLIEDFKSSITDPDLLAVVQSELVLALRDNDQKEDALDAARMLKMEYATDSSWIQWADNAIFDLENLAEGMPAPDFNAVDVEGNPVSLETFQGKHLILEFYVPGRRFEQDLFIRNQAYRASGGKPAFEILSFSLQADSLLNRAFFDGRDIPGRHVFLPDGGDAAILNAYNIIVLPTRFLIDPEGKIVGKYVLGNGSLAFQEARSRTLSSN